MLKRGINFLYILCLIVVIVASMSLTNKFVRQDEYNLNEMGGKINSPYCLQMYTSIEKYTKEYKVPKYIAYNVAYLETRYRGPFDWNYDHRKISSAGAQGPMQIITRWAHSYAGKRVTDKELRNNIDMNVKVSIKMLRTRYEMTGDWGLACGGYNTGSPVRNSYAVFAESNKNYKNNWVKY